MIPRSLLRPLSLLTVVASLAYAQLQAQDVQPIFPGQDPSTLKAGSNRGGSLTTTAVANSSHVLVVLNYTSSGIADLGWMGHGRGSQMNNGDLWVFWPNSDDTITASHRQPADHVPPQPIDVPSNSPVQIVDSLTSKRADNTPFATIAFLRPVQLSTDSGYSTNSQNKDWALESGQQVVWAYNSNSNPNSKDASTMFDIHSNMGVGSIDLSQSLATAGPSVQSSGSSGGDSDSKYNKKILAHAVLGSLAFVIFSPAAIIIARFFRTRTWFPIHRALQILTLVLVIITFALGVSAVNDNDGDIWDDTHHRLGLFVFIFVLLQGAVGFGAHAIKLQPGQGRDFSRWIHVILGISVQLMGWAQVRTGYEEWTDKANAGIGRKVPTGVVVVFWVLAGIESLVYLLGIGLWPRSFLGRPNHSQTAGEKQLSQAELGR